MTATFIFHFFVLERAVDDCNIQFSIFRFLRINWWLQHSIWQCEARAVLALHLNFVTSCQKLWRLAVIFNVLNCPLGSWTKSARPVLRLRFHLQHWAAAIGAPSSNSKWTFSTRKPTFQLLVASAHTNFPPLRKPTQPATQTPVNANQTSTNSNIKPTRT